MSNDIHRKTAAELFGIPEEEVTEKQRQLAKTLSCWRLYGARSKFGVKAGREPMSRKSARRCPLCEAEVTPEEGKPAARLLSSIPLRDTEVLESLPDVPLSETGETLRMSLTGRPRASEPALQNIPIRTEEGRRIREAFVPGTPDQGREEEGPNDSKPGKKKGGG